MPNDPSSESSRRDVSNAVLFGTDTSSSCGDIDRGKSAQHRGVIYTAVYPGSGVAISIDPKMPYL